ncbi:MAG: hypothetical protein ABIO43_04885 [Sphingomicrobium sp.]
MHRIDTSGNVNNRFSEGNPQAGQMATRLSAEWFNDVQENLLEVLEQAGIAPVKGAENQLYLAIVALIAAGGGGGGGGGDDVPLTRLVNAAGLATGGGALNNDITITVAKALTADIIAGLDDTKAITSLGLAAAYAGTFSGTGYAKLPGGLIFQWGAGTAAANATTIFTLPLTFPNACHFAAVEGGSNDLNAQDNNPFVAGRGTGSISVFSARDAGTTVNWMALGN